MEQTMKCGKIINSQGRHIHLKFCPVCSEDESKKNVFLEVNNDSKLIVDATKKATKTDIKEVNNDSKLIVDATKEATKTDIKEADSDSNTDDDGISWVAETLGIALLGFGLFVGLIYLAYKCASQKAGNNNIISKYVDTGAAMPSAKAQYVDILSSGLGVK